MPNSLSEKIGLAIAEGVMLALTPVISCLTWVYVVLEESHKWLYNIEEEDED